MHENNSWLLINKTFKKLNNYQIKMEINFWNLPILKMEINFEVCQYLIWINPACLPFWLGYRAHKWVYWPKFRKKEVDEIVMCLVLSKPWPPPSPRYFAKIAQMKLLSALVFGNSKSVSFPQQPSVAIATRLIQSY